MTEQGEVLDGEAREAEGAIDDVAHVCPVALQTCVEMLLLTSKESMKAAPTFAPSSKKRKSAWRPSEAPCTGAARVVDAANADATG